MAASHVLSHDKLVALLQRTAQILIPALSASAHKGSHGRVGIVGGCAAYTGAPYFAALAALRTGADLATVICAPDAAVPIKAYSPELIVRGILPADGDAPPGDAKAATMIDDGWALASLHAVSMGSGLGRAPAHLALVGPLLDHAAALDLPVVLDGDALFPLGNDDGKAALTLAPAVTDRLVVTPNAVEYRRLCRALLNEAVVELGDVPGPAEDQVSRLAAALHHATVVRKGAADIVANAHVAARLGHARPSLRRCGGQGDVLAGTIAVFLAWATLASRNHGPDLAALLLPDAETETDNAVANSTFAAALMGAIVTRDAASVVYHVHRRATNVPLILESLPAVIDTFHDDPSHIEEVILGPMFSGKTTELLRRVRRQVAARKTVAIIKSAKDTRGAEPGRATVTHDDVAVPAYAALRLADVPAEVLADAEVVGIDEGQFFDDVMPVADELANSGKIVVVATLDGDFMRRPFASTGPLVAAAERVTKLTAVCMECLAADAPFSKRLIADTSVEVIGGKESYAAMCRNCYNSLSTT
ncbi:uncharacterized protein AMSG_12274 [Thecamonas trahens ATCC 50062]|uniref:ATP-dependent (S)-NAD(P)H-hydrate dehydratase n=1 Tax=Thecamonas trahens ATCC 50062 TaxID=461836 RepID=A0A0L0DNN4_THETB|nr:hypothetical protein AMSG_12274 [Thecamonas trahens ATCC 50062]KNC53919.1 hypothetical protein AMSG_12274 [Thecamonas trahens ATCC 50062]|eukprot:XP_013754201.1 hypothetical protein AMSG_12274 [Thecamonas trahens ATCC 50062]